MAQVWRSCVLLLLAFGLATVYAATESGKRVALVVGNSSYANGALTNPRNDATAMRDAFVRMGFDVEFKLDATRRDMDDLLRKFGKKAETAEVATLFYAGHGVQIAGENYLVPIGAAPETERDVKREMVRLGDVIDEMGHARIKIIFFDACRDNPMTRSFTRSGARGLAAPKEDTSGTLISFATKHGQTASDGDGKHSPYTMSLLEEIEKGNTEIEQMLRRVQQGVRKATKGVQEPWRYGSLDGDYYFIQPPVKAADLETLVKSAPDRTAIELEVWQSAKQLNTELSYQSYLAKYENGQFADLAKEAIRTLRDSQAAKSPVTSANTASVQDPSNTPVAKVGAPAVLPAVTSANVAPTATKEDILWMEVEAANTQEAYSQYLRAFPSGQYAEVAQLRLAKLKRPSTGSVGVKEFTAEQPGEGEELNRALRRLFRQKR